MTTNDKTDQSLFADQQTESKSQATSGQQLELSLVGEGKKYRTVGDLEKAYNHADSFIETILREKKEVEAKLNEAAAELERRKSAAQVAEALQSKEKKEDSPAISKEEIENIVAKALPQVMNVEKQKEVANTNLRTLQETLLSKHGDQAKVDSFVQGKLRELNMPFDTFMSTAMSSHKAALVLLGETAPVVTPPTSSKSTINTQSVQSTNSNDDTDWSYWRNMRKESPNLYNSEKMVLRRHSLAQEGKLKLPN